MRPLVEVSHVVAEWAFTLGLKRLREASENSNQSEIARRIGKSRATIGHYEMGRYLPSHESLDIMLDAYGHPERAGYYRELRDRVETHVPDWWEDRFPDGFPPYPLALLAGMESSAVRMHVFESNAVPELLRTPEYAEHVVRAGLPTHDAESHALYLRMLTGRQEVLERDEPPELRCVLEEAVLRRTVGSTEVLARQLARLEELAHAPHIEIRILTDDSAGAAPAVGAFTELMLPSEAVRDFHEVVYVSTPVDRIHYESTGELDVFHALWRGVTDHALSSEDSRAFLGEVARTLRHDPARNL